MIVLDASAHPCLLTKVMTLRFFRESNGGTTWDASWRLPRPLTSSCAILGYSTSAQRALVLYTLLQTIHWSFYGCICPLESPVLRSWLRYNLTRVDFKRCLELCFFIPECSIRSKPSSADSQFWGSKVHSTINEAATPSELIHSDSRGWVTASKSYTRLMHVNLLVRFVVSLRLLIFTSIHLPLRKVDYWLNVVIARFVENGLSSRSCTSRTVFAKQFIAHLWSESTFQPPHRVHMPTPQPWNLRGGFFRPAPSWCMSTKEMLLIFEPTHIDQELLPQWTFVAKQGQP